MKRRRGSIALQPATPQGDAQGWSDDDDVDGGHRADSVQFAGSLQTTPGRYHIFRTVIFVFLALSLPYLSTSLVHLSLYCCILDLASRACISPCIISCNLSHTTPLSVVFPASLPASPAYSTSLVPFASHSVPLSSPTYRVEINFQYIALQIAALSRVVRKRPRPPSCLRVPGNLIPTNLSTPHGLSS
jgi:hypothetical protein